MNNKLTLPWPPSVNKYYRTPRTGKLAGRTLISEEGRRFRTEAVLMLRQQKVEQIKGRVAVMLHAYPPDRRRRDLDNLLKGVLDALVHAGAIEDDSLVDDLHVIRKPIVKDGQLTVFVRPADATEGL